MNIYGLNKCTTCQKALDFLAEKNVKLTFTDHSEAPPTKTQVAAWANALGGWEKMINRAGYTWRGLARADTENLTGAHAVALAVKHPSLIRRPLIEHDDGSVTVGFAENVKKLF